MNTVSISQLKTKPSKIISQAEDYPVAVEKRNEIKAYLIGKELYERLITYIEDYVDRKAVEKTDFSKGKNFEKIASELGL